MRRKAHVRFGGGSSRDASSRRSYPTDETRGLAGEIGQYVVAARWTEQTWYLGVMNNEQARRIELPLDFLDEGRFQATIFQDDPIATPDSHPPLTRQQQNVSHQSVLVLDLPQRSGATAILTPASMGQDRHGRRRDNTRGNNEREARYIR